MLINNKIYPLARIISLGIIIGWLIYYIFSFLYVGIFDRETSFVVLPILIGTSLVIFSSSLKERWRIIFFAFGILLIVYWLWDMSLQLYYMD